MLSREDLSRARQRLLRLQAERQRLEEQFLAHHRLLKGTLLERLKVCLKPGCKCTRGEPHPSLTYLSWSEGGKTRQVYVPAADRERVGRQVVAYQALRRARGHWVKLQAEVLELLDRLEVGQRDAYPFGGGGG